MAATNSGSSGQSDAVRAGKAFVEMSLSDTKLGRGLEAAKAKLQAFSAFSIKIGAGAIAGGASILAPLTGLFASAVEQAGSLDRLSTRIGTSVENLSKLGYAATVTGGNLDTLKDVAKDLQDRLSKSIQDENLRKSFASIGVNAVAIRDADLPEQLGAIADGLAQIQNPADRTRRAMELLGEGGLSLLPLLARGSGGIRELMDEAAASGQVVTTEQAVQAREVSRAWNLSLQAVKSAILSIGQAFLPQAGNITQLTQSIAQAAAKAREFVLENKGIIVSVGLGAAGLIAFGAAAITVGAAASGLVATLGAMKAVTLGVISVVQALKIVALANIVVIAPIKALIFGLIGALTSLKISMIATYAIAAAKPLIVIGLLVGAAVAVTSLFNGFKNLGDYFRGPFTGFIAGIGSTFKQVFGGIMDALGRGDFAAAFQIAVTGGKLAWAQFVVFLQETWNGFKSKFVDGWRDVVTGLRLIWNDFASFFEKITIRVVGFMTKNFGEALSRIYAAFARAAETVGLDSLGNKLREASKDVLQFDTQARLQQAEQKRIDDRAKILQERQQKQLDDNAARDNDLAAAKARVAELQRELAKLIAGGRERERQIMEGSPVGPQAQSIPSAVRGAFRSSDFRRMFGSPDKVPEQQLQVQQAILRVAKEILGDVRAAIPKFVD